jgi:hypothetical protein
MISMKFTIELSFRALLPCSAACGDHEILARPRGSKTPAITSARAVGDSVRASRTVADVPA